MYFCTRKTWAWSLKTIKQRIMAEENQEPKKGRRELFVERLKAKYPDQEYADDEALFGRIDDDYTDYDNQLNRYRESEGKLTNVLETNHSAAQFLADMANEKDPWVAVIKRIGSDGVIELINDPAKQEAYQEANKEYVARLAKEKELEAEYNQNLAESMKVREAMDAQYGEAAVDAAIAIVDQIMKDALVGKVTKETIEMAMKMANREADIENARSEGEIAGRNAKIEEQIRKPQAGDGMPQIGGANAPAPAPKKRGFFDDLPRRKF